MANDRNRQIQKLIKVLNANLAKKQEKLDADLKIAINLQNKTEDYFDLLAKKEAQLVKDGKFKEAAELEFRLNRLIAFNESAIKKYDTAVDQIVLNKTPRTPVSPVAAIVPPPIPVVQEPLSQVGEKAVVIGDKNDKEFKAEIDEAAKKAAIKHQAKEFAQEPVVQPVSEPELDFSKIEHAPVSDPVIVPKKETSKWKIGALAFVAVAAGFAGGYYSAVTNWFGYGPAKNDVPPTKVVVVNCDDIQNKGGWQDAGVWRNWRAAGSCPVVVPAAKAPVAKPAVVAAPAKAAEKPVEKTPEVVAPVVEQTASQIGIDEASEWLRDKSVELAQSAILWARNSAGHIVPLSSPSANRSYTMDSKWAASHVSFFEALIKEGDKISAERVAKFVSSPEKRAMLMHAAAFLDKQYNDDLPPQAEGRLHAYQLAAAFKAYDDAKGVPTVAPAAPVAPAAVKPATPVAPAAEANNVRRGNVAPTAPAAVAPVKVRTEAQVKADTRMVETYKSVVAEVTNWYSSTEGAAQFNKMTPEQQVKLAKAKSAFDNIERNGDKVPAGMTSDQYKASLINANTPFIMPALQEIGTARGEKDTEGLMAKANDAMGEYTKANDIKNEASKPVKPKKKGLFGIGFLGL